MIRKFEILVKALIKPESVTMTFRLEKHVTSSENWPEYGRNSEQVIGPPPRGPSPEKKLQPTAVDTTIGVDIGPRLPSI